MTISINIYSTGNIIEKTYNIDDYTLPTGFVLQLIKGINIDDWFSSDEVTMGTTLMKIVLNNFDKYYDLFKTIFPDLTPEEWNRTKIDNITSSMMILLSYTISKLFSLTDAKKN